VVASDFSNFASLMISLNVLQEMGAWQSTDMVRRYAHLAPETFGVHASVVDRMLYDTNKAQNC